MKISLQTKVSIFITLIIVAVSSVSTYFFTTAHSRTKERGLIARGMALSSALSKAAEEGLIRENLSLMKKASYIIKSPDVDLTQIYSGIWEPIDAYPSEKLKELPHQKAVMHFKNSIETLYIKLNSGYDFYSPILFRIPEKSTPTSIGFVRIFMSSGEIKKEINGIVAANILAALLMTLFAVISINMLIGHMSAEYTLMYRTLKEKDDLLIESDKKIRSLFERVEHIIFRLDKNGLIIETNKRFNEIFGDVTNLCDILIGESSAPDCIVKAIAEKTLHIEDKAISKKGDELVISLALYPAADSSGNITGIDGYIMDITEKKRLEERLIRSQKMEAVGTLAGGMAHDYNNLMTAIMGYSEILVSMTKEGDPFYKPASIIFDAAQKGADLGKKILTITRKEKIEAKPVNVNDVVRNSMELLQRTIPKNIEIIKNLIEDIPNIKGDFSQLQQVIINLAVNARDAMPDGGKLFIETSVVGMDGADGNMNAKKNGMIKLSISDTGAGIDAITQGKIFDPFFTTKEIGKGTGLGLYIVHSIINNHSGYINLYSERLKGTQFNIYLPIIKTDDNYIEKSFDEQNIKGSGIVLVIDDESGVRELCRDMLEPLGYSVLLAESGSSGIKVFREMKDKISVVVLDMIMPKMGGSEVFQALRTVKPDAKVILCSGYSSHGFAGIDELMKQGAVEFVQKPFSRQNIALAIKKAL